MPFIIILLVLVFSAVLSYIEIPPMLQSKSYRELWSFSVILFLGVVLVILKSFNISISNPSDWIAWMLFPISNWVKNLLQ